MASHEQKFESAIQLYTEGNRLFDEVDKLFDEADALSDQEDKLSNEIDRLDDEYDNLREEQNELYEKSNLAVDIEDEKSISVAANAITPKLFQLESDSFKLRRSMRESSSKNSELRAKGRAVAIDGARLHAESHKVWLEGLIEWTVELGIKPPPR